MQSTNQPDEVIAGEPIPETRFNVDFMRVRLIAAVLSAVLIVVSIASLFIQQMNLGLDFTGGTLVEVAYEEAVDLEPIRKSLANAGFNDAVVQHFGRASEVLIRVPPSDSEDKDPNRVLKRV